MAVLSKPYPIKPASHPHPHRAAPCPGWNARAESGVAEAGHKDVRVCPGSARREAWAPRMRAFLPNSGPGLFEVAPLETHENPVFLAPRRRCPVLRFTAQAG